MSRLRSDIDKSIWASSATVSFPPVPAQSDTDIAIIGGGFTGLTAALHLAQRGRRVTVLEAGEPGIGASGVNAGFVVPNFAKADPAAVRARLGRPKADRLLRMIGAGQSGFSRPFAMRRSIAPQNRRAGCTSPIVPTRCRCWRNASPTGTNWAVR